MAIGSFIIVAIKQQSRQTTATLPQKDSRTAAKYSARTRATAACLARLRTHNYNWCMILSWFRFDRVPLRRVAAAVALLLGALGLPGCVWPRLMPAAHLANRTFPDGSTRLVFDTTGNGRGDYAEYQDPAGRLGAIEYDTDRDGELDDLVRLQDIDPAECRDLLIILDSVPYALVRDAWNNGRFRMFNPPSRVIAPFPVMTDLSLNELFQTSPTPGIDARYFDGRRMTNGYLNYMTRDNSAWLKHVDYHMSFLNHAYTYLHPWSGFRHELWRIEQMFLQRRRPVVIGYSVGTSAIGSVEGRSGHERILDVVDRFCRALVQRTRGRVQITLMSDHGHNLVMNHPTPIHDELGALGFRDSIRLQRPGDIVTPRFGPVTCAGIYTHEPARVAAAVRHLAGVELVAYPEAQGITVLTRTEQAVIECRGTRYRYAARQGDPLRLEPVLAELRRQGKLDADDYAADQDWLDATVDHIFPDALHRLWRAFHGLLVHTPDVLVSLQDGHCHGTAFFDLFIRMESAHGSLRDSSTYGFVMSTAVTVQDPVRMEALGQQLPAIQAAIAE